MGSPGSRRRRRVEHVLAALRPSLAELCAADAKHFERAVRQLDSAALVAAVVAADDFFVALREYPELAEECGESSAAEMLADAINALQEVVEAGRDREQERRAYGVHGVATQIVRGDFGGFAVRRREVRRPGPRPRERRSDCAHRARRRGSRRATGSGSRAGPDDPDADDPPGNADAPPAGGQVAELIGGAA
jgi:hypothetical protein